MEKDLLKIIEHFGVNNQQRKLQEEVFELQEAITRYEFAEDDNTIEGQYRWDMNFFKEHIIEEIADITVILKEVQYIYKINREDIRKIMKNKINRTLERIESGYYEK